jgi:dGTPase
MENLAHLAFKSEDSFGRALPQELDRDFGLYDWMDPYDLDKVKLEGSKAIRRLGGKTQVISGHKNVHIRNRLTHSLEVLSLCEQIGHRLKVNVPLLRASALSHDFAHVILGHLGESYIGVRLGEDFRHERFVVFVLEMIEREGQGANISYEVLYADRYHSRGKGKMTKTGIFLEADILMYGDKLSYIFSDLNDIKRVNFPNLIIPDELMKLGSNQTERLYKCAKALCLESIRKQTISFEDSEEARNFMVIRDFMYEEVYHKIDRSHLTVMLNRIFDFFERYYHNPRLSALTMALMSEEGAYVLDGMIGDYSDGWIMEHLHDPSKFAIAEFLPNIPEWAELDFCNPDRFLDKKNFGKVPKIECFAR